MNGHLVRFCHTRGITLSRSRPYHKNDNAHVEEKNNSVIRKFVGHDRHDTQEEVDLLNRTYRFLHLLVNWFLPSQKLLHKVRTGSHITKVYDSAQTPCARMLARMDAPEETKQQLRSTCAALDLTSLHHKILLPRGCCLPSMFSQCEGCCRIRGVYWPGTSGCNRQKETIVGHQETRQPRVRFQ